MDLPALLFHATHNYCLTALPLKQAYTKYVTAFREVCEKNYLRFNIKKNK